MKTVIVTGGRDYQDKETLERILNILNPELVIQGGASGADRLAFNWALGCNVDYGTFEANWDLHGKSAGPIRNREMLKANPNAIVVAFPGGKGTANCVSEAIKLGMIVLKVQK